MNKLSEAEREHRAKILSDASISGFGRGVNDKKRFFSPNMNPYEHHTGSLGKRLKAAWHNGYIKGRAS